MLYYCSLILAQIIHIIHQQDNVRLFLKYLNHFLLCLEDRVLHKMISVMALYFFVFVFLKSCIPTAVY